MIDFPSFPPLHVLMYEVITKELRSMIERANEFGIKINIANASAFPNALTNQFDDDIKNDVENKLIINIRGGNKENFDQVISEIKGYITSYKDMTVMEYNDPVAGFLTYDDENVEMNSAKLVIGITNSTARIENPGILEA